MTLLARMQAYHAPRPIVGLTVDELATRLDVELLVDGERVLAVRAEELEQATEAAGMG